MTPRTGLFAAALRRVRLSALLPLLGGNLLILVAAVLALRIPDSHTWQFLLSVLLALGLISGLLLWNALAMRRMRTLVPPIPLWTGAVLLGAWLLLAVLLFHVAGLAEQNMDGRAGYWNSQLSPGMRHLLPYGRLINLQQSAIAAFRWVFLPALLLPFAMETATFGLHSAALGRASRTVSSVRHWLAGVIALGATAWIVPTITAWHPAHTVRGEVLSAVARLGFAGLVTVGAVVLLLATDAELLDRRGPAETQAEDRVSA